VEKRYSEEQYHLRIEGYIKRINQGQGKAKGILDHTDHVRFLKRFNRIIKGWVLGDDYAGGVDGFQERYPAEWEAEKERREHAHLNDEEFFESVRIGCKNLINGKKPKDANIRLSFYYIGLSLEFKATIHPLISQKPSKAMEALNADALWVSERERLGVTEEEFRQKVICYIRNKKQKGEKRRKIYWSIELFER
jgi:hypothetical protein